MSRLLINPREIHPPLARYNHAVVTGGWLLSSGTLGIGRNGEIPEEIEGQCAFCFENVKAILQSAQMTFDDVVRFNAFVTDRSYFEPYGRVRARYVTKTDFASTLVIVSGFTRPEFKIEIEIAAFRQP